MKEKIFRFSKKVIAHELISGSMFIFFGGLISNVFSFLYNLFLVRSLSFADYAAFASLTSILILVSLPSQSLLTIITRFATDYFSRNKEKNAAEFYIQSSKFVLIIGFIIFIFICIFSYPLSRFLQITSIWYVVLVGALVGISYLGIVNTAFLQSLLHFKLLAFYAIIGSFFRLAIGALLIMIGWKVYGALGALVIAYVIGYILNIIPLKFLFSIKRTEISLPWRELLIYALPTSFGVIALSSFTSTDIILVKHFFTPHDAGLYSGISLIGRVIFYFTAPIPSVMFPLVIKRFNKGENVHGLFYLALGLVFFSSLSMSLFYFIFPKFVISFFLGGKGYLQISPFLALFGINITLFSVVNVFSTFFLSLKKTSISYIIALAALLQIIFISLFHKNFFQIICISIILSLLLLITLLIYYFRVYGQKTHKKSKQDDFFNYSSV